MKSRDTGAQIIDKRKNWEARVEMAIFKRPSNELSAYDKLVYAILCGHANRDGNAMLYVRTISEESSCSERQAQRALSNLEARGLLIRRAQNRNGRQTFNIYEVYGFDAYISSEPAPEPETEREPTLGDSGVTDSHRCMSDTQGPSDSHPRGDSQAGLYNVFEQPFFNSSKKEHIPPTPQQETEGEKNFKPENQKPQKPEHDTEGKTENSEPNPNAPKPDLTGEILSAYNETLQKLPIAEKLTASRIKTLNLRIREDTERKDPEWWKGYFRSVRDYPWLMGNNPSGWKANFDWLIGENGMRKVIEGSFTKIPGSGFSEEEKRALQRKYTDERGRVNAEGLLREWRQLTGEE
ncbi:MAG: helix-turn-helix domain-containing protein [Synergistaceae bacterium]|jgi:hypothetical protein|nr:helix-turn-helix domain-containing protein [Synergistaceae bacterium]